MSLVGRGDVGLPPAVSRGAEGIFLEECFEKRSFFQKQFIFQFRLGSLFPSFQRPTRLGKGSDFSCIFDAF